MNTKRWFALGVVVLPFVCWSVVAAARQQGRAGAGTERPGEPTRSVTLVENRGRSEAIPITTPDPIQVLVQNPQPTWEYQVVAVTQGISASELSRNLSRLGADGWETTGVQLPSASGTLVVFKRRK